MHKIQQSLLKLIESRNIATLTLREIADLVGPNVYPQQIKHHLSQLEKKGIIRINKISNVIEKIKEGQIKNTNLISVPIMGMADCGPATCYAEQNIEGYLKISSSLLEKAKNIFAVKANGPSMNKANIKGNNIEDGDYVIIDSEDRTPKDNMYVLSTIEGVANIKKFIFDKNNNRVILLSESTKEFPPIIIDPKDESDYMINGKVIQVIKKYNN